MPSIRIYQLAKKLGKTTNELLEVLEKAGIAGKTHSSGIDMETAGMVEKAFKKAAPQKEKKRPEKKAAKKSAAAVKKAEKKATTKPATPKEKPKEKKKKEAPRKAVAEKPAVKPAPKKKEKRKAPPAKGKAAPEAPVAVKPAAPPGKKPERPIAEKTKRSIVKREKRLKLPAVELPGQEAPLPEEETELKVPDRFKKAMDAEKMEKFQIKPGMQKAFQAIRKIDHRKRFEARPHGRRHVKEHKQLKAHPGITAPRKKTLKVQEGITVKEFAEVVGVKLPEVIKKFMELGYTPTINQALDLDAALLVADALGVKVEVEAAEDFSVVEEAPEDASKLVSRPPVVTIMGHVDHGKTSLLDAIRETRVMDTEAGGITQHIGAYKVSLKDKEIVFLDTPGHEAFTALRARGAKVTDLVVLIVAADDGVKPQTIEAIDHARAANVPIIVAINKIDKPEANPDKVRTELADHGIVSEEWGGQNIFAEISAKKRTGLENLLELILLQAEVLELKANPERLANCVIREARLDRTKGPVATLLLQRGTLRVGDAFLSGVNYGRVRALFNDKGKKIKEAGPSTPVEVMGFGSVPIAGDFFIVMEDEKKARQVALARLHKQKSSEIGKKRKLTLDDLYSKIKEGGIKDLNIIIKGDVQGSVEALKDALQQITHSEVQVKVIHSAAGGINESDVMLAAASNAIIIGFNVRPETKAAQTAEDEGIDIELYNVIYEAIDDVKKALEGLLEPTLKEKVLGRAEVRQTFVASRLGTIAGCMVVDGLVSRNCDGIRLIRDSIVVYEGRLASLKRFKEDVKEVQTGYECGIMIENYNDVKVGDIIENYVVEKVAAKL
jgi:translation initiation factor IF-2